jgi:hypothetical protein
VLSLVGSIIIDTKLFEKDISEQLRADSKILRENAFNERNTRLKELNTRETKLSDKLQNSIDVANKERYGKGISGKQGDGPSFKLEQKNVAAAEKSLSDFQKAKTVHERQINLQYNKDIREASERQDNPGLLMMVSALHNFIFSNSLAMYVFIAITFVFFSFEVMVLSVKIFSSKTADDIKSELSSALSIEEAKTRTDIRSKKLSLVRNTYDPRLERAREVLNAF